MDKIAAFARQIPGAIGSAYNWATTPITPSWAQPVQQQAEQQSLNPLAGPLGRLFPDVTPKTLMNMNVPGVSQVESMPPIAKQALGPITQTPSMVQALIRQLGRYTGLQPSPLDIAMLPGYAKMLGGAMRGAAPTQEPLLPNERQQYGELISSGYTPEEARKLVSTNYQQYLDDVYDYAHGNGPNPDEVASRFTPSTNKVEFYNPDQEGYANTNAPVGNQSFNHLADLSDASDEIDSLFDAAVNEGDKESQTMLSNLYKQPWEKVKQLMIDETIDPNIADAAHTAAQEEYLRRLTESGSQEGAANMNASTGFNWKNSLPKNDPAYAPEVTATIYNKANDLALNAQIGDPSALQDLIKMKDFQPKPVQRFIDSLLKKVNTRQDIGNINLLTPEVTGEPNFAPQISMTNEPTTSPEVIKAFLGSLGFAGAPFAGAAIGKKVGSFVKKIGGK